MSICTPKIKPLRRLHGHRHLQRAEHKESAPRSQDFSVASGQVIEDCGHREIPQMRFCEAKGFLGGAGKPGTRRPRPPGPTVDEKRDPLPAPKKGQWGEGVREGGRMPKVCAEKRPHGMQRLRARKRLRMKQSRRRGPEPPPPPHTHTHHHHHQQQQAKVGGGTSPPLPA
eukprot:COSAG04_NODE_231_length_19199_cov_263.690209_14_plen_170_part_00